MAWVIDAGHSAINFSARHMMLTTVRGQFEKFSGTVNFDEQNPANSSVDVTLDTASLQSKDEKRDGHLKSPDFLDVATFPTLSFKSKRIKVIDENSAKITGDLTIKDVTKEVTLDVDYHGQQKAPWGSTSAGFTGTTKINREDWGLTWNAALEAGGLLVGKDIKIEIDLEIVKQPEAEKAAVA
jgi:polyisoprenoid-binding protein YceI